MEHYDAIGTEYDITTINTSPNHQLLHDLYYAIEDFQRWRPEENTRSTQASPSKRQKTEPVVPSDIEMETDDDDELQHFPKLQVAEKYRWNDIQELPLKDVEQCLREYYIYSNTEPGDDYYDLASEEILRQHLFEAVVALLIDYEIGIKYNTTDETIENMDLVFVYKKLHKINLLTNPKYRFQESIATTRDYARRTIRKYRDDLARTAAIYQTPNDIPTNVPAQQESHSPITNDHTPTQ